MLDYLPAPVRHSLIALAGALLSWAAAELPNWNVSAPLTMIIGTAITIAATYLTPLTRQYGVGAEPLVWYDDNFDTFDEE